MNNFIVYSVYAYEIIHVFQNPLLWKKFHSVIFLQDWHVFSTSGYNSVEYNVNYVSNHNEVEPVARVYQLHYIEFLLIHTKYHNLCFSCLIHDLCILYCYARFILCSYCLNSGYQIQLIHSIFRERYKLICYFSTP